MRAAWRRMRRGPWFQGVECATDTQSAVLVMDADFGGADADVPPGHSGLATSRSAVSGRGMTAVAAIRRDRATDSTAAE